MHFSNRCSSLTRIALQNIQDNKKICAHNYSHTAVCFQRFSVVLGHFPKASCAKHVLVTKASFFRKLASTLAFGIFNISETNRVKDMAVSIQYISINFDIKFHRKKKHNSLFLRDQTQRTRTILKALYVCINSGFKPFVILPFLNADDLKEELLLWTSTVVLTKVCSFS